MGGGKWAIREGKLGRGPTYTKGWLDFSWEKILCCDFWMEVLHV